MQTLALATILGKRKRRLNLPEEIVIKILSSDYGVVSGLYFDSSNNEYKVVMAFSHETPSCRLVVIGSFQSKTWIVVHFPSPVSSVKSSPVVNGNLHWFASKESWGHFFAPHQTIYFNPQKNIFKKLPMPKPKDGDGDILLGLGVLDGCLCMVRSCEHPTNHVDRVEVLVMKKYGIKESWTTMLILSNLPNLRIYDNVVPLDIRIPIKGPYVYAVVYEESLASLIDYNWEAEELRGDARHVENSLSGSWRKMRKIIRAGVTACKVEGRGYRESDSEYMMDNYTRRRN
ncbi:hypothetical protein CsSME_00019970 [Camellia sinensis var. sinensis]